MKQLKRVIHIYNILYIRGSLSREKLLILLNQKLFKHIKEDMLDKDLQFMRYKLNIDIRYDRSQYYLETLVDIPETIYQYLKNEDL